MMHSVMHALAEKGSGVSVMSFSGPDLRRFGCHSRRRDYSWLDPSASYVGQKGAIVGVMGDAKRT
jgi:hypothetical protein